MSTVKHEIAVEPRTTTGKCNARRSRKAGWIPAVIYHKGAPSELVSVKVGDWAALTHHDIHLVYLNEGAKSTPCLLKEVQFNHLKNYVVHIDFQSVNLDEVVHAELNIHLIGDAIGVSRGGVLEQVMHTMEISGSVANLPEFIEADVTKLNTNEALHVKDLVLPAGVKALEDADAIVAHVVFEKEEAEAAPAEGAEPAVVSKEAKDKAKAE